MFTYITCINNCYTEKERVILSHTESYGVLWRKPDPRSVYNCNLEMLVVVLSESGNATNAWLSTLNRDKIRNDIRHNLQEGVISVGDGICIIHVLLKVVIEHKLVVVWNVCHFWSWSVGLPVVGGWFGWCIMLLYTRYM